jgi:antitoxin component of RelBE/YafQ-DinJ toxin-antitoxin module
MPVLYARVSDQTHAAIRAVAAETGLTITKVVDDLLAAQLGLPARLTRKSIRAALQRLEER